MTKFKIGDIVVAHKVTPYSITTKGWTGKVTRISSSSEDNIFVESCPESKKYSGWVCDTYFDLKGATPSETTSSEKFKVGDWVIGNENADRYGITVKGWIGEVIKVKYNEITIVPRLGSEGDDTGYDVNADCFDLYDGPKDLPKEKVEEKKTEILKKRAAITNAEAYILLFGVPHKHNSCITDRCADCPISSSNGGSCGNAEKDWWNKPYTGTFKLIDPDHGPRPDESKRKKIKTPKDNICTAYNKSDLDGLKYIKDNELWNNAEQYAQLEMLLLLHELIFVHNSETYSETAYRIRYYAFLAELGIGIDENGYAFVKEKK